MFKICAIGCGDIAATGHGPAYAKYKAEHPSTELAGCCDLDAEKADYFRKKFGFKRSYTNYQSMLTTENPDAVCLIVPVAITAALSVDIMKMGFPVLMEKPPGRNESEVKNIMTAAETYSVYNMAAFNRRFCPAVVECKNLLKHFTPHEILSIDYYLSRVGRKDKDFSTTAIHAVDTAKYLAGSDYKDITFHYQSIGVSKTTLVTMNCVMESEAAVTVHLHPLAGAAYEGALIQCKEHTYVINIPVMDSIEKTTGLLHFHNNVPVYKNGYNGEDKEEWFINNGFYNENKIFFECIRQETKPENDVHTAFQSVVVADCLRTKSHRYMKPA